MKQRNLTGVSLKPHFSFLTLSLVMGASLSAQAQSTGGVQAQQVPQQQEEVSAVPVGAVTTSVPAQQAAYRNQQVQTTPVVAPALTAVPVNVTNNSAVASDSIAAPGTDPGEIDSSKNSNGSGIQIFNLNNNKPTQDQASDVNTGTRADILRRERVRQELQNESRLVEKIEEDRIHNEGGRSNSIEGVQFGANGNRDQNRERPQDVQEVQVVGSSNPAPIGVGPTVSTYSHDQDDSFFSSREFKIAPLGGYRWATNNNQQFRSESQGVFGIAVEGRLANALGLEVNYQYGRDKLYDRALDGGFGYGNSAYGATGYGYNTGYNSYANTGYGNYGFVENIRSRDTHEVNANLKLGWFVGEVRPFVLGGIGARYASYNIDNLADQAAADAAGWSRSSTHMTSSAGAGLDYRVARNFSIGARAEWEHVFSNSNNYLPQGLDILYGDTNNNIKALANVSLNF